jgi:hypothetical protein
MMLNIPQPLREVWQPGKYSPIVQKYQWSGTSNCNPLDTNDMTLKGETQKENLPGRREFPYPSRNQQFTRSAECEDFSEAF